MAKRGIGLDILDEELSFKNLEEVQTLHDKYQLIYQTKPLFKSVCLQRTFQALKNCQETNPICAEESINFQHESTGKTTECTDNVYGFLLVTKLFLFFFLINCTIYRFKVAQDQCKVPYLNFLNCLSSNNGLYRNCPTQFQELQNCLNKNVQ